MPLIDKALALLAMALFIGFLGILVWWVRELDLIIVIVVVTVMALYDFWLGAGHGKDISVHNKE